MADVSNLISVEGDAVADYQDTVTQVYRVEYDSIPTNFYAALIRAQEATTSPVPLRRSLYTGTALSRVFATNIHGSMENPDKRSVWLWSVTFSPAPPSETLIYDISNPLDRPAIYDIQYMDREYVIERAKNTIELTHGDGKGGSRAADTLGPIVNAAGKRPDEPIVDTERLEVLVIKKNYPTLATIVTRNRTYKRTTNSSGVVGYSARELRYLLTESQGLQVENGIEFWPGVTMILAEDTTDLTLDNVGYEYWVAADSNWKRAVDKDGEPTAEPINLKLDGDKGGDNTTTLTYRHLSQVDYEPLFV